MISNRKRARFVCFYLALVLILSLSSFTFAAPKSKPPEDVVNRLSGVWEKEVITSLQKRLTLLAGGFWVSGASCGDHLYGVAIFDGQPTQGLETALAMQATRAAFYDWATPLPASALELESGLREELKFYIISKEAQYRVEKLEETAYIAQSPPSFFVKFRQDKASFKHTRFYVSSFADFLYNQAILWLNRKEPEEALFRIDWVLENSPATATLAKATLTKGQIQLAAGNFLEACLTILPLLDYEEKMLFQIFSKAEIGIILTIFEKGEAPELGIDLAALAFILYPEERRFEQQLLRLLEQKEGAVK